MANLKDWVVMCAGEAEFVSHFNRLYGTKLSFTPIDRSGIEQMIDRACGHVPMPVNADAELKAFFDHCVDLWCRICAHEAKEA